MFCGPDNDSRRLGLVSKTILPLRYFKFLKGLLPNPVGGVSLAQIQRPMLPGIGLKITFSVSTFESNIFPLS